MKQIWKRAIGFLMAVALLAGNSYFVTGAPMVTVLSAETGEGSDGAADGGPSVSLDGEAALPYAVWQAERYRTFLEDRLAAASAAAGERYVFIQPDSSTNNIVESNSTVDLTTSTKVLFVSRVNADGTPIEFSSDVTVEIYSGNTEVVSIDAYDPTDPNQSKYARTLRREGPGYAQITATITDPSAGTTIITCLVHVGLKVVTTDADHWKNVAMDDSHKVLVLNQKEGDYQISLKYVDDNDIETADLTWSFSRDGVVSVEDDGKLQILGAGYTRVTVTTDTNNGESKADTASFEVIVTPIGSESGTAGIQNYSQEVNMTVDASSFTLYSNGNPATNLIWEVYSKDVNGNLKRISQSDKTLLSYVIGEESGVVNFTGVKAGTYVVYAYATKSYDAPAWTRVVYNIVVKLNLQDQQLYMNVGDTYSILDNSNIPEAVFNLLFSFTVEPSNGLVADVNGNTSVITAYNEGHAKIVMHYNATSNAGIYDSEVAADIREVTYTIDVIDGISLNSSSLSLYTGSTYQLKANVTNRLAPITWVSADPSTVSVDSTGMVTALKPTGTTRPVKVTAYQTINGIVKSASCDIFVQPSVTQVTLNPKTVSIGIGEYETIKATLSPSGIANVSLTWVSSDPGIFEVVDGTDLTATIQGKAGGMAVLTAINNENIVVGYCTVTVNQQAAGISLSETSVISNLATKYYQLYATITPSNTTNQTIIWSTTNPRVATVDQNGKVTFVSSGTVSIVAQSKDNPELTAFCEFTIQRAVTGIDLDVHSLELYVGATYRMTYLISPSNASITDVTWTSFSPSVVSVDSTGMLTARGTGTTQLMVMTSDGAYYDICTIVVKQKATSVKLNITALTMNANEYFDLDVTVAPVTATEKSLTWESLNTSVVTVSSTGRVTARSAGTAIVMVKTESGSTSYCTVTVLEPVRSLKLDPEDVTLDVGEKFTIDPIFTPTTASNTEVKWTSSDSTVASINAAGEVTAKAGGTVVITCESVDGGYRAFALVRVEEPVVDLTLYPESYRLGINKSVTLEATITNHNTATNIGILWSSSDETICTVNDNGKVTGLDFGYATITAEAADGSGAYATCEIRVVREVTSIKLNYSAIQLIQGESVALLATVQPSNATYQNVDYTVIKDESNKSTKEVVMVDDDGVVTALNPGTVMVQASAQDNSGKVALCYITVIAPVASTAISVSDNEVVLAPGERKSITTSIRPANSTDSVVWTSNNEAVATVSANGTITAVSTGSATVTVMTSSGRTAMVNVIVVGLSRTSIELPVYTQYSRLTVDGATTTVRWDVEDVTICQVTNGVITARKVGTTVVTATVNGRTLKCRVKVVSK